jgi:class 3 adenylate cyclase
MWSPARARLSPLRNRQRRRSQVLQKCGQALGSTAALAESRFASPHTYTPKHLAEKILVSRASLEGERKQVTVLFVDVSGFTALSDETGRVVKPYFQLQSHGEVTVKGKALPVRAFQVGVFS